jgi:hypothetical protein
LVPLAMVRYDEKYACSSAACIALEFSMSHRNLRLDHPQLLDHTHHCRL